MPRIGEAINDMGLPAPVAQALGAVTAAAIGGVTGGGAGAASAYSVDINNRQLHPTETAWIKSNAQKFADKLGISETEAEKRLADQAFRQVQFGAAGSEDADARAFLRTAGGQLLPTDSANPSAGPGYMFYATPAQRANATMYVSAVVNSPQALEFYRQNNIKQPTVAQIAAAAGKDQNSRNEIAQLTIQSAAVAGALALAPALSGLATEAYAFTQNPVAYCTLNPTGCIVAADLAATTVTGVPTSGVAIPGQVGKAVGKVAEAELNSVKAAERVSVGSLAETGAVNLALENKANGELLNTINNLGSKSSARGSSVMVGAYDSTTGLTSVGASGALKAEDLSPVMVKFVEDKLGVPIGQATSFCSNLAGFCAEVKAADKLVRQGADPANIKFTNPVRPGMVYGNTSIPENAFVPTCANCSTTWPNGYKN